MECENVFVCFEIFWGGVCLFLCFNRSVVQYGAFPHTKDKKSRKTLSLQTHSCHNAQGMSSEHEEGIVGKTLSSFFLNSSSFQLDLIFCSSVKA